MTKQEILNNVFNKLKYAGVVESKKDFAEKMEYNYTCLSAAMNGEQRYLTKKFFEKVLRTYPMINPQYLANGTGEVLVNDSPTDREPSEIQNSIEESMPSEGYAYTVNIDRLVDTMRAQVELTNQAQEQTKKALEQMDQLIDIIKQMVLEK